MGETRRQVVETYTTLEESTGQVLDQSRVVRIATSSTEDNYWKVYCVLGCGAIGGIPYGVLDGILRRMGYASAGQVVNLSREVKLEIAESVGGSIRTVERSIRELVDGGILRRQRRGVYQVNPYFFGKGSWAQVNELRGTYEWYRGDS